MFARTKSIVVVSGVTILIAACVVRDQSAYVRPRTEHLPRWQDENGVKPDWVFVSLINKCNKRMDYKLDPSTTPGQGIDVEPADGYKFWKGAVSYKEMSVQTNRPATLSIRDGSISSWQEAFKIPPGSSKRLQIEKDCQTVVERTDNQRYAGCYQWSWTSTCPRQTTSSQPDGCPEGTPSVEGDMSRPCQFQTVKGSCTIQFAEATAGCDIRR